jgi:threonine/homoserine/homoserine lactone efflux protein
MMIESFIVISLSGLLTGFIFSVPAAGPVTILIISKGLKGMRRFCHRVAYGASIADLIYVFVAVYAFSNLFEYYQPYIPYILTAGSVFLIVLGVKIVRTKLDMKYMSEDSNIDDELINKGGFRTGMAINFLNPALFAGWLISSFFVLSLIATLGFNTGGLSSKISSNISSVHYKTITKQFQEKQEALHKIIGDSITMSDKSVDDEISSGFTLILSLVFSMTLALGSTIWFYFLGSFVVAHRQKFKMDTINKIIHSLGVILIIIGLYFVVSTIHTLMSA